MKERFPNVSRWILPFLVLPAFAWAGPHGNNPCAELLLRAVVENHGVNEQFPRGFSRHRTLLDYLRMFPAEVGEKIANLGPEDVILEAGSGEGVAAEQILLRKLEGLLLNEEEMFERTKVTWELATDPSAVLKRIGAKPLRDRPTVIAVSKEMERTLDVTPYQGKLIVNTGRFFEDIPAEELGRPKLILDAIGVMSYTAHPTEVLERYLEILQPEGDIYLFMDLARVEIELRKGQTVAEGIEAMRFLRPVYANQPRWIVKDGHGASKWLHYWLLSLDQPGLSVEALESRMVLGFFEGQKKHLRENRYLTIHMKKTGKGKIKIPQLTLEAAEFELNPPSRTFLQHGPLPRRRH